MVQSLPGVQRYITSFATNLFYIKLLITYQPLVTLKVGQLNVLGEASLALR